jgi:hypothetical protein
VGLLLLIRILFDGFGFHGRRGVHRSNQFRKKWMILIEEEQKGIIEKYKSFHEFFHGRFFDNDTRTKKQRYRSTLGRLLKFICSRVAVLEDAEDILQDVFYQFTRVDSPVNPIENTAT